MKSIRTKLKEGRCLGIGETYTPFYTSQEARSIGTSTFIPDPIEHRSVHVLSMAEASLYYLLRWDDTTMYIREQFLLDSDYMNYIREMQGLPRSSPEVCYTTDFLVDYKDGSHRAFSVKADASEFNPDSSRYQGRLHAYYRLIKRQLLEKEYWETQGIPFSIVTANSLNRIRVQNIRNVLGFYNDMFVTTREQKLMYLLAHKYYSVDMDTDVLNPKALLSNAPFDVDSTYERMRKYYGEIYYSNH